MLALVVGGLGFESVGLSSELGALAFGAMLAKHPRAGELSNSLWSVKEVFLVGFFLQIGIGGLPDADALIFAALMSLLLPLKTVLFFFLFLAFRLRSRSAFLSAASLTNYSEFGLIVMSVAMPQWLVPLAITVAFSFILSAQFNRVSASLYNRLASRWCGWSATPAIPTNSRCRWAMRRFWSWVWGAPGAPPTTTSRKKATG